MINFKHFFPDEAVPLALFGVFQVAKKIQMPILRQRWELAASSNRPRALECRQCGHKINLTTGTIIHRTQQSLPFWFWTEYL